MIYYLDGWLVTAGQPGADREGRFRQYIFLPAAFWSAGRSGPGTFRAARFENGKLTEKPIVTVYFNGQKAHTNVKINQVWGGENSGLDGGNDGGKGITDTPGGLKLQAEGHAVLYRNIWIQELNLKKADTDF